MGDLVEHFPFAGERITGVDLNDERVILKFPVGSLAISDAGQSCCEQRYITCDDDLTSIVGARLLKIEAKPGPDEDDEYDVHEIMFVDVLTDVGFIQLRTHNVHNGFYGGFILKIDAYEGTANKHRHLSIPQIEDAA